VLPLPYQTELQTILSAPFFLTGAVVNGTSTPLANTFPNAAYPLLTPNRVRYAYVDPRPPRNYVLQWNLSMQQQLAPHLALFIGYIGSRGEHLPYHLEDFNMVLPTKTAAGYVWPASPGVKLNPALGQIDGLIWNSTSIYHGLQTQLTRELSHGLQAGLSYTWAKSLDTSSSSLTADNFPNVARRLPFDPQSGKGVSDFNIGQVLTMNYIWQIPEFHPGSAFLDKAANGWQLGGIYQFRTGLPFTPIIGGDPLGMLSTQPFDYPDQLALPGCNHAVRPGNPTAYIRTECFAFPSPKTRLGNVHRNSMFGPSSSNFDVSLFKNTPFALFGKRELDTQFRVEAFNVFNHVNFAPPLANHTLFDVNGNRVSNAGLLDSTVTTSRQIQFGIKLTF
jgi:hypothetical protein